MLYAHTMAVYKHFNRFLTAFRNDRGVWAFYILIFLWAVRAEAAVPSCILSVLCGKKHKAIEAFLQIIINCQLRSLSL